MAMKAHYLHFVADENEMEEVLQLIQKKSRSYKLQLVDHIPKEKRPNYRSAEYKRVESLLLSYQDKKRDVEILQKRLVQLREEVEISIPTSKLGIVVSSVGFHNSQTETAAVTLVNDQQSLEMEILRISQELTRIDFALLQLTSEELEFVRTKYLDTRRALTDEEVISKLNLSRNKLYEIKALSLKKLRKFLLENEQNDQVGSKE
ncbi:hypothetical protein [Brevibacillus laterosporus]|uniref:hypothetical protein n=1 Tax=Brevibacillus laterosporus TaxID=1465 RepID=UPI00195B9B21|nr:hypothetical protein [Brevibacillus laterosporus]MBM7109681.1 hypothetical protein [Brevibacillus laterosporus]